MDLTQRQFVTLAALTGILMYLLQPAGLIMDELAHVPQIHSLLTGSDTHLHNITTFLFVHKIYAGMIQTFDLTDPVNYRWLNFALMAVLIWTISALSAQASSKFNGLLAAQLFFLPIALPYYPLIYTDIIALLMIYFALLFFQKNQHGVSALFLGLAVLVRQPSLVWVGFFATLLFFESYRQIAAQSFFRKSLLAATRCWPYVLVVLVFFAYFIFNQGIALGDKGYHRVSVNITNVYFMLLLFFILFMPLLLDQYKAVIKLLKSKPWLLAVVSAVFVLYLLTFAVTHDYNAPFLNMFLRNWLINHIDDLLWLKCLSALVSIYAVLAIITIDFKQTIHRWLYLFLPVSVIGMPLIEQRYYMVGMALWLCLRNRLSRTIETAQLVWMILWSLGLYVGLSEKWFLL